MTSKIEDLAAAIQKLDKEREEYRQRIRENNDMNENLRKAIDKNEDQVDKLFGKICVSLGIHRKMEDFI